MKPFPLRLLFTLIFSVISTALASVMLYTFPVLDYVGYQTQIEPVLIGFIAGALLFSTVGTLLTFLIRKPVSVGLYVSLALLVGLGVFYRITGPTDNFDIFVGALATQSFSLFFATMFQSAPEPRGNKLHAVISIVLFTIVSLILFVITAGIYIVYGQAFLPNIIVYFEVIAAVLSAIMLLVYLRPQEPRDAQAN